jgi:putative SOS response-associated peptidase YedK
VATKPAFHATCKKHRCRIPTDGCLASPNERNAKLRSLCEVEGGAVVRLGRALRTSSTGGERISRRGNPARPTDRAARRHDRMPVIVAPEDYETWLTAEQIPLTLLSVEPDDRVASFRLSLHSPRLSPSLRFGPST